MDLISSGQVRGSLAYFNGTTWEQLPSGPDGYALITHNVSADPTWSDTLTNAQANFFFGDGYDGDLSLSSGVVNLFKDTYFRNVTISGTGSINTNSFRMFVSNVLDLSNAPANAIRFNGNAATSASGTTAGTGGAALTVYNLGGGSAGANGGSGSTALNAPNSGDNSAIPVDYYWSSNGGNGSWGAPGGNGSGSGLRQTLGSSPSNAAVFADTSKLSFSSFKKDLIAFHQYFLGEIATVLIWGGVGGSGGSAGKGSNSGISATGAGGAGGGGAGVMFLSARTINRGVSTSAGCIAANGGVGGNGGDASGTAGGVGGGGAGGGGSGGFIYLCYYNLVGSVAANIVSANGGSGGNGGTGYGSGTGGYGGGSSCGGFIQILNLKSNVSVQTIFDNANNSPVAGSGTTGGTGQAGHLLQLSL